MKKYFFLGLAFMASSLAFCASSDMTSAVSAQVQAASESSTRYCLPDGDNCVMLPNKAFELLEEKLQSKYPGMNGYQNYGLVSVFDSPYVKQYQFYVYIYGFDNKTRPFGVFQVMDFRIEPLDKIEEAFRSDNEPIRNMLFSYPDTKLHMEKLYQKLGPKYKGCFSLLLSEVPVVLIKNIKKENSVYRVNLSYAVGTRGYTLEARRDGCSMY